MFFEPVFVYCTVLDFSTLRDTEEEGRLGEEEEDDEDGSETDARFSFLTD